MNICQIMKFTLFKFVEAASSDTVSPKQNSKYFKNRDRIQS